MQFLLQICSRLSAVDHCISLDYCRYAELNTDRIVRASIELSNNATKDAKTNRDVVRLYHKNRLQ